LCSQLTREQSKEVYSKVFESKDSDAIRRLCKEDLFFLLLFICKRKDIDHDWLYARCREVEANPDGYLDLWAREHYKSTIITFGLTIQDILKNPEVTIGIFSHTKPIAKSFLSQIKREFESNKVLQDLFPEILFRKPQTESPCWSEDKGLIVRRKGNPNACTLEAWGLVDGQPTSRHFTIMVYDDVVTLESVTTPEQIEKVTNAWAMSSNLESEGCKKRHIGTRYHANDTYRSILERKSAIPRIYPCTLNGTYPGQPVLLSQEALYRKRADQGPYIFSCQMLQDPMADNSMGFKEDWLIYYNELKNFNKWNYYILVDSASEKKKTSDYTVISVIGLAPDRNYYLVDGIRDRMNLTERTRELFKMVRKWEPHSVGYEKYGLNSDIEHIKYVQEQEGYRFNIVELSGQLPKNDRIRRLVPIFEQHRFFLPNRLMYVTVEGKGRDFVDDLKKYEYLSFPVCVHDDILDCISRILDPELMASFPKVDGSIFATIAPPSVKYDPYKMNVVTDQNKYNPLSLSQV
jgi:phage terminase large subunit-like protein